MSLVKYVYNIEMDGDLSIAQIIMQYSRVLILWKLISAIYLIKLCFTRTTNL
jgi:hypothetical protein